MKKKSNDKSSSIFSETFSNLGDYLRKKYGYILIAFFTLLLVSAISFFKISTAQTVAAFTVSDFELGMISDKTIIADRSLPGDEINPVSVIEGEKIVKKGFPVTEESIEKLNKLANSPVYMDYRAFANNEIFLLILTVMWYLLFSLIPFGRKIKISEVLFQVIFFLLIYFVAAFAGKLPFFSTPYSLCIAIPSTLFVVLYSILYGNIPAILYSFLLSFGVLNASSWQLVPFFYTMFTCLVSCILVRSIQRRIDMVIAAVVMAVLNVLFLGIIATIFNSDLLELGREFAFVAGTGFLSGILALGLLTPFELLLNTSSVFRLMELSDLNNPFMQNMLVQASGTYQHSMMVAQLAENACREIGANALVARVGAYYHDIGKIDQSEYFVENQKGENSHDKINPSLSVSIIRSHVKKGVEKAHQLHLPPNIIDIIAEHHGNSVIAYFYNEAKEKDPTLEPEDFSYMGNPPTTRESAVVMLADTVEAACRTLENPSVPRLEKFITTLVNAKVDHKQLDNCDLTFRDITKIKESFVQLLAGYYHSRIEYPDQEKDKEKEKE